MTIVNKAAGGSVRLTRRTVLQGAAGVGIMLGLGGLASTAGSSSTLLRPPGGQDEAWLLASCLKCNKCVDVCPTDVVALAKMTDGLRQARTPVLNFHLGYCTLCNKCVEACPSASLTPQDPASVRIGLAQVNEESCVAWQMAGCTKCKTECGYEAISLDEANHPVIDADKCNGCGKCEFICPSSQLGSYRPGKARGIVVRRK